MSGQFETSLTTGHQQKLDDFHVCGMSLSGIRTALAIPELSLCFDVAQAYPFVLRQKKFFISHGHLDHSAGIPYLISQKAMHNEKGPDIYMPESLIEPMNQIMRLWEKIEGHEYQWNFIPISKEQDIELNQQYFVRSFPTVHRIQSFGYCLFSRKKKLKTQYANISEQEILKNKKMGIEIDEVLSDPVFAFTGDTQIEFLDLAPWVRNSKYLFLECTYLDDKKSVEHARKWGHTHINELLPRLDEIQSEKIFIIHASSRYSTKMAQDILKSKIPKKHESRVELFLGR